MEDRKIWMEQIMGKEPIGKENCPFCSDDQNTIKVFQHWKLLYNKYPYNSLKNHTLLITKRHVEHTKNLNPEELLELSSIEAYMEKFYERENYFSFIRQTDGGKSIKHIHYHYLPGALYSDDMETLLKNRK